MSRNKGLCLIFLIIPAIICAIPQGGNQQDQNWNRRVEGAGNYQIVLEVSGRNEVSRYLEKIDPVDLTAICAGKEKSLNRAFLSAQGYLRTIENSANAHRRQIEVARLNLELGQLWSYRGEMTKAIEHFEKAREALVRGVLDHPEFSDDLIYLDEILGISYLRQGELENCVHLHHSETCIFPLTKAAQHTIKTGSSAAVRHFTRHLKQRPENLEVRWLLNLAHMTLGSYPKDIPADYLIPAMSRPAAQKLPRFPDAASRLGIDFVNAAGGAIMDDFDNDGLNDLVFSSVDACDSLRYYRNNGDGAFTDLTDKSGLSGQLGGINCVQTDYNNDGRLDIFVMRGGWEFPMRNSLLRNNGDNTFTDVTKESGLLSGSHRTHSAAWADFDLDGWLDLFVGHEETPSQLFRNRRDGTFEDVSEKAGVNRSSFVKAVVWGDYDQDGYPDLYVSNYTEHNLLYRNLGDGRFEEVAEKAGVSKPLMSFPAWFFDYDNDGLPDLFVAGFVPSVTEIARWFLKMPPQAETMKLYRNDGRGGFIDVTAGVGLDRVIPTMGANFGDLDNDGFLDFYLGTGAPSYAALMPNFMFRNLAGRHFVDVTEETGTGHLQKGHGVAFGDLDNDGDQDIFANMGGFIPGDKYNKALFANPLTRGNWISIKLIGRKSNRAAIGARIKVTVTAVNGERSHIFREVSSGGSFGASPLTQHIGLGQNLENSRIDEIEIAWPAGKTKQIFKNISVNQFIEIEEMVKDYKALRPRSFRIVDNPEAKQ